MIDYLKDELLHIDLREETLDCHIKQYICDALCIENIDQDEIDLFYTLEVGNCAVERLEEQKALNFRRRHALELDFLPDKNVLEIPQHVCADVLPLLEKIDNVTNYCFFFQKF